MNNKRRSTLSGALKLLEEASNIVSQVLDEEQDSFDNIPENLQDSDRYLKAESAVESLEEAIDSIDEAKDSINSATE